MRYEKSLHLWFAVAFLAGIGWIGPVQAQTHIGTVCLSSVINERETGPVEPETVVARYDVTNLGGNAYSVTGYVDITNEPFVTTGQGVVINGVLIMNITTTQRHVAGWRDTGINQTRLDLTTMSGSFYEIGRDFDPTNKTWDSRYTAGTVSRVDCP
jgi:hypothetical protein